MFGLSPLVLNPGAGTELYRGLGAIVLFGILFSTLVTITFVPALLCFVMGAGARVGRQGLEPPPPGAQRLGIVQPQHLDIRGHQTSTLDRRHNLRKRRRIRAVENILANERVGLTGTVPPADGV